MTHNVQSSPDDGLIRDRWQAHIITLFPEMFPGHLGFGLASRASDQWGYTTYDLRDFGEGVRRNVDDTPAGGGAGMILRADIGCAAIDYVREQAGPELPLIVFTPRGIPLVQVQIAKLAQEAGAILFCGRYEGIDERLVTTRKVLEVSLGDFVLSGGEPAALCLIDAVIRLRPGVMGNATSARDESFTTPLLEYPHYTKPAVFENIAIPEVLQSGDHARIAAWRRAQAEATTRMRRPDLWQAHQRQVASGKSAKQTKK